MIGPSPMCVVCVRLREGLMCEAYPDGIPTEIIMCQWDHRYPKPGDHGLQFSPKDNDEPQPWWPNEANGSGQ